MYATGGLRFWNDGRDVPDVMLALLDYPGFTVQLKVNFESGTPDESFGVKFIGSEGTMTTGFDELKLSRTPRAAEPGYTIDTFPEAVQKKFLEGYRQQYPVTHASADSLRPNKDDVYTPPEGFDAHLEHHRVFYEAVRARKPSVLGLTWRPSATMLATAAGSGWQSASTLTSLVCPGARPSCGRRSCEPGRVRF